MIWIGNSTEAEGSPNPNSWLLLLKSFLFQKNTDYEPEP